MAQIAGLVGLGLVASFFWYAIGAVALVYYIVVHSSFCREKLLFHPLLPFLGRMSFALYLTHIPLLYTVTCWLLVHLDGLFGEHHFLAAIVALSFSLPFMFGVAFLFMKYVDEPSILYSNELGHRLLGISEADPSREYNISDRSGTTTSAESDDSADDNTNDGDMTSNEEDKAAASSRATGELLQP